MNCDRARQYFALALGEDHLVLPETPAVLSHLRQCGSCREFEESIRANQCLMRSFRQETASEEDLGTMRKNLFEHLDRAQKELPWWIRLERFLIGEFRRPRFVTAGIAIIIVSLTLFAQLRYVSASRNVEKVALAGSGMLERPRDYGEWIRVGSSLEWAQENDPHLGGKPAQNVQQSVFMNPGAYRDFVANGAFPEGTVLVLESVDSKQGSGRTVSASLKDRRYPGGWAYFRFTDESGKTVEQATPVPEEEGCLACHGAKGATDHVFTQFYPVLRSASGVL